MVEHRGITYLRAARPETHLVYSESEKFDIGGAKLLKQSPDDQITVVATGITVFEALAAAKKLEEEQIKITVMDAYCIKPLAGEMILAAAKNTGNRVITVEDHYSAGGLGDAVAGELSPFGVRVYKLAVYELPHSGTQKELLEKYQIDSTAIINKVHEIIETQKKSQAA
jgi:transketolase